MSPTHGAFNHVVAFEMAKDTLAVHVLPGDGQQTLANQPKAIRKLLLRQMRCNAEVARGPLLVVCEATGGYEKHVLEMCVELGLAVHKAHGSRVHHFAKYLGQVSGPDRQDRPDRCACSPCTASTPRACACISPTPQRS